MNIFFIILATIYGLACVVDLVEHGKIEEKQTHAGKTFIGSVIILTLIYLGILTGF